MTLKDIAAMAEISVSTVSRILNSPDNSFATEAVRERVWRIVRETGYVPNSAARNLKLSSGKKGNISSNTIACVFGRTKTPSDNPFFVQLARAIEQQALQMGYAVACTYSVFDIHDHHVLHGIVNNPVDGAIVMGRFGSDTRNFFEKHYKNIIYTGVSPIDLEWDQVVCDGDNIPETVMSYLFELGHRRIGYIGELGSEIRYVKYREMLLRKKIEPESALAYASPQTGAGGYAAASQMLANAPALPTAVFCATDTVAIGAIRRFGESGILIPQDISIISVDNIELSQYVSPMLTTVNIPKEELGRLAVRMLVDRLGRGHKLPLKLVLPYKMIIRESTGPVPENGRTT